MFGQNTASFLNRNRTQGRRPPPATWVGPNAPESRQGTPVIARDGTVDANRAKSNPGLISAAVTRAQWNDYLDRYRPIEQEALKAATQTDFSKEGDAAGRVAQTQERLASGILSRGLSRTGTTLTAEQNAGLRRRAALSGSQSVASAENVTRRNLSTERVNALGEMVAIGRGIQQRGASGLGDAANMQAQRDQATMQNKSAARNANMQAAGSLASMALMAAFV